MSVLLLLSMETLQNKITSLMDENGKKKWSKDMNKLLVKEKNKRGNIL